MDSEKHDPGRSDVPGTDEPPCEPAMNDSTSTPTCQPGISNHAGKWDDVPDEFDPNARPH